MKRRNFILLLGGASSGAMSVGTGAFSSVEAEREVSVSVVEDENAYLGLDDDAGEGFVRIKNQFAGYLDLTITAALPSSGGNVEIEAEDDDIEIEVGAGGDDEEDSNDDTVSVDIPTGNSTDVIAECDGDGSLDIELTFMGEVGDTEATVNKTRTFTVECDEGDDGGESNQNVSDHVKRVKFAGGGKKIRILTTENGGGGNGTGGVVDAKVYCGDEGQNVSEGFKEVHVNTDVWIDSFEGDNLEKPIAKVEIDGAGVFENPDPGTGKTVDNTEDDPT